MLTEKITKEKAIALLLKEEMVEDEKADETLSESDIANISSTLEDSFDMLLGVEEVQNEYDTWTQAYMYSKKIGKIIIIDGELEVKTVSDLLDKIIELEAEASKLENMLPDINTKK